MGQGSVFSRGGRHCACTEKGQFSPRPDPLRTVLVPNLLRQGLVEGENADLGTTVVARPGERDEAGDARNRDDVAVVVAYHGGQEFLDGPVVRHQIDLERPSDQLF